MEPVLRVVPKEKVKYLEGPIYEYDGESTILGTVTYRSKKGYSMTVKYGHIPVIMCDTGEKKFGGYYEIRQVKIVKNKLNEDRFEVSINDGVVLPIDDTVEDAIGSVNVLVSVMKDNLCSDEFDD